MEAADGDILMAGVEAYMWAIGGVDRRRCESDSRRRHGERGAIEHGFGQEFC